MREAAFTERARPAPLVVRRNADIYATEGGWYRARWHFSFDRYYDPDNMGIGLLRVFNHDTLVPGAVWPMHPHRDIEGITYVVAGTFEHADSLGNGGILAAGGAQRMTLGAGAWHSERNHSPTEPMQFIQMWILPSRPGLAPSVEQKQYAVEDRLNKLLRIVRPETAEGEGVLVHQEASVYVCRLDSGNGFDYSFARGRGGYFYLIDGAAIVNGSPLATGDAAKVTGGGVLTVDARRPSDLIFVDTPLARR
jgi:hypothetical protein